MRAVLLTANNFIVPGTRGHSLDSSLTRVSKPGTNPVIHVGSRIGIDATKPSTFEPEKRAALNRIFPKGYGRVNLEGMLDRGVGARPEPLQGVGIAIFISRTS
ncbi:MAG: hypothetical protein HY675_08285 [Chloroflexi bacterium]|nr:hypothetical protein [Chloroflexota bacterium]